LPHSPPIREGSPKRRVIAGETETEVGEVSGVAVDCEDCAGRPMHKAVRGSHRLFKIF